MKATAMTTAVRERPILFSGEMVRAILAGRKTQTRRLVKPQPPSHIDELHGHQLRKRAPYRVEDNETGNILGTGFQDDDDRYYIAPSNVGDRLWVRESFAIQPDLGMPLRDRQPIHYLADIEDRQQIEDYVGKPSIHMPRWASRITLEVTGVRVERLWDISESDSIAEGVTPEYDAEDEGEDYRVSYRVGFVELLWRINGRDSWDANPWVWVLEFKRIAPSTVC